jgi:hypothetical protein
MVCNPSIILLARPLPSPSAGGMKRMPVKNPWGLWKLRVQRWHNEKRILKS